MWSVQGTEAVEEVRCDAQGDFTVAHLDGSAIWLWAQGHRDQQVSVDPSSVEGGTVVVRADVGRVLALKIDGWTPTLGPRALLTPVKGQAVLTPREAPISADGVAIYYDLPEATHMVLSVQSRDADSELGVYEAIDGSAEGWQTLPVRRLGTLTGTVEAGSRVKVTHVRVTASGFAKSIRVADDGHFQVHGVPDTECYVECGYEIEGRKDRRVKRCRPGDVLSIRLE
jgi:hypothetical protein